MMRSLPAIESLSVENLTLDKFMAELAREAKEGLSITGEEDILIDNLQGVVSLNTSKAAKISLHTVESALLQINAPNAHVSLNLKSIHDLSHINCASAEIIIGEGFEKCHIFDQKTGTFHGEAATGGNDMKPTLKVLTSGVFNIKVMSDFEILRQ